MCTDVSSLVPSLRGAHWPQTWGVARAKQRARLTDRVALHGTAGVSPAAHLGGALAPATPPGNISTKAQGSRRERRGASALGLGSLGVPYLGLSFPVCKTATWGPVISKLPSITNFKNILYCCCSCYHNSVHFLKNTPQVFLPLETSYNEF